MAALGEHGLRRSARNLRAVNALCGLVKGQAAQHCYGSAPYAPFTGSRQGGVSHDCARLSEPRSFDDGQDRGSIPAHTFPRSVTARSRGSHESAMRCVTWRGTGVGTAAWCQSQGPTGPVRSRASWWQGNMVQRARDLPDHRTKTPDREVWSATLERPFVTNGECAAEQPHAPL